MGLGVLELYNGTDLAPLEILDGFDTGMGYSFEIVWAGKGWPTSGLQGMTRYVWVVDCGLTIYCSECGVMMCPGCRQTTLLSVTAEGPRSACDAPACVLAFCGIAKEAVT